MNYCTFLVKILKKPEKIYFENDICVLELPVKFSQFKNSSCDVSLNISFWGNLANEVIEYYQLNDYVIIEGYISFRKRDNKTNLLLKDKQIEMSVFKIYPYRLNK